MKKGDRIGRFERFKCLRYRQTNQQTNGHDLLQKCEDALKNTKQQTCIPINGCAFVIAAQQKEILRILDLVGEQQADSFKTLLAAIDVVAEEEIVGLRGESAVLEQTEKIVILTVNVAANLQRRLQF